MDKKTKNTLLQSLNEKSLQALYIDFQNLEYRRSGKEIRNDAAFENANTLHQGITDKNITHLWVTTIFPQTLLPAHLRAEAFNKADKGNGLNFAVVNPNPEEKVYCKRYTNDALTNNPLRSHLQNAIETQGRIAVIVAGVDAYDCVEKSLHSLFELHENIDVILAEDAINIGKDVKAYLEKFSTYKDRLYHARTAEIIATLNDTSPA